MFLLNGAIIGLCKDNNSYLISKKEKKFIINNNLPIFLSKNPVCECLGLGIIKHIDPINKLFYILTPISTFLLPYVNTFLIGDLNLPSSLLLSLEKQVNFFLLKIIYLLFFLKKNKEYLFI